MTAASKTGSLLKLHSRDSFVRRTRFSWREVGVVGEEVGKRTRRARRGMGPSAYARIAEITSGRAISQQGLVTTCKDPPTKGVPEAEGGIWSDAWARRSEEGGVMLSEVAREVTLDAGNARARAKGPWALGGSESWAAYRTLCRKSCKPDRGTRVQANRGDEGWMCTSA